MEKNYAQIARANRLIALNQLAAKKSETADAAKICKLPALTSRQIDALFVSSRGARTVLPLAA